MTSAVQATPRGETIHCVFATDGNFIQHLGVTIVSLAENNRGNDLHLHVVHHSVSEEGLAHLRATLEGYPDVAVSLYAFDASDYAAFPISGHINLVSYFRLFLTDLLPAEVGRILYLDSDVVIERDLAPFHGSNLHGLPLGAVVDPYNEDFLTRLPMPADHRYFNAGVLVIDLDQWRRRGMKDVFVRFVEANAAQLRFHDQDVLNATFAGRVAYLSYEWNFQARTKIKDLRRIGYDAQEAARIARAPAIIHYTTNRKPWYYRHNVPFEERYLKYLRLTAWRDYRPPDKTAMAVAVRKAQDRMPFAFRVLNAVRWRLKRQVALAKIS